MFRKSFFGGATDHYKLYGQDLYYYDVNSLYSYTMLNDMTLNHKGYHSDLSKWDLNEFFWFCLS